MAQIRKSLVLSEDDWAEVYQALLLLGGTIASGAYHPKEYGDLEEWKREIQAILAKIGPDGSRAAEIGVAPIPDARTVE